MNGKGVWLRKQRRMPHWKWCCLGHLRATSLGTVLFYTCTPCTVHCMFKLRLKLSNLTESGKLWLFHMYTVQTLPLFMEQHERSIIMRFFFFYFFTFLKLMTLMKDDVGTKIKNKNWIHSELVIINKLLTPY